MQPSGAVRTIRKWKRRGSDEWILPGAPVFLCLQGLRSPLPASHQAGAVLSAVQIVPGSVGSDGYQMNAAGEGLKPVKRDDDFSGQVGVELAVISRFCPLEEGDA